MSTISLDEARTSSRVASLLVVALLALLCACGSEGKRDRVDAGSDAGPLGTPDDCITDVSAGDHTFTCGGLTFLVMVDEQCTRSQCGLIFDVHGGTMSGKQMRDNTQLHELAPPKGYLVVHPSATAEKTGGSWTTMHYPIVADFMMRTIAAFQVDPKRVHMTGFSQGSMMTFWFLCNHGELLASAAPVAFAGGDCIDAAWEPRVPLLYMNGIKDTAATIASSRAMIERLSSELELGEGEETANDGHYTRTHYTDGAGMELDYIEHDYGGQPVLDGHCLPGGIDISGAANNFGSQRHHLQRRRHQAALG